MVIAKSRRRVAWAAIGATGVLVVTGLAASACGLAGTGAPETTPPTPSQSPSVSPGDSSTVAPVPATPEPSPTPSPEETLKQKMADFISGTTVLPKTDGRFYLFDLPGQLPAMANVLAFNGVVDTDYTQPFVQVEFQAYLVDARVVTSTNGRHYLIGYVGQESKNGRYVLPVNFGSIDTTDKVALYTNKDVVAAQDGPDWKETIYSTSEFETQIGKYFGSFVLSSWVCVSNAPKVADARLLVDVTAQNQVARDTIEFSKRTLLSPIDTVPRNSSIADIINKPVQDGFPVAAVPLVIQLLTQ